MRWLAAILALGWATAEAAQPPEAPAPREQLREILSRPLYSRWRLRTDRTVEPEEAQQGRLHRLIDEWIDWLERHLMPKTSGSGRGLDVGEGGSSLPSVLRLFGYAIVGILAVFLVFLIIQLVRDYHGRGQLARVLSREQVQEALAAGDALALGSPQWLEEAERLARERDFRAVYRALYLALLAGLHARSLIDFRRNRTNWTYVRGFRGPDDQRATFASLTDLFDRVWYGLEAAAGSSLDGIQRQMATLVPAE